VFLNHHFKEIKRIEWGIPEPRDTTRSAGIMIRQLVPNFIHQGIRIPEDLLLDLQETRP
jgi:hypothetical protein